MAKEVELNIKIDKTGKVTVEPKGTSGKECLDLMKFLDEIPGFEVKGIKPNKDMQEEHKEVINQESKTK
jgi:putative aminopeptidase FrvX